MMNRPAYVARKFGYQKGQEMRDFDRSFARAEKTVKRAGCGFGVLMAIQVLFALAVMAGIVYFIAFAITHWLKW